MQHVYIIVEGPSDELILSNILDGIFDKEIKIHFYVAHGVPGIVSSTKPILDLLSDDAKVIVVYDAETGDRIRAEERNDVIKSQVLNGGADKRVRFIYFIPTIDCSHPYLTESAMIKRKVREEYNARVSTYIKNNKEEFLKIEQIKEIIAFVKKRQS